MGLPGLEPFTPTGVGSLLEHAPALPYAPQLPNRSARERLVPQTAEGLPGIRIDPASGWAFVEGISIPGTGRVPEIGEPVVSEEAYPGLFRLLERLRGSGRPVQVHLAGPVTVASRVTDGRGRRAVYDPGWRAAAATAIGTKGAYVAKLVRDAGCEPLVILDEPSLAIPTGGEAALTSEGAHRLVAEALEGIDAPRGVHCCARADWDRLFDLPADLVSFDAHAFGEEAVASGALGWFLQGGGRVMWGIVPASGGALDESVPGLVGRLRYHLGRLERSGITPEQSEPASVISPSCGLGGLTGPVAARVTELLTQVAAALRPPT
jgi:hypothetical protein